MFTKFLAIGLVAVSTATAAPTNTFVVAAYNIENWVLMERNHRPDQPKPEAEKNAVADVLVTIHPDVLGLEEMGTTNELAELTGLLAARGLKYPYSEWIQGQDTNRHVALLSRFPITERNSRTDYTLTIATNVLRVSRGVLDVRVKVNDRYSFRAVVAHLKSHRQDTAFDQAVTRLEEARVLRRHVERALQENPALNLIVMGDFNDTPETETIQTLIGKPPLRLMDLMPQDSAGGHDTHYWRYRKQWSRIDYLLLSPGMSNRYVAGSARIADVSGWDKASDHRAVSATFRVPAVVPAAPAKLEVPVIGPGNRQTIFFAVAAFVVANAMVLVWLLRRRQKLPSPAAGR
jgi:endonuclease/exonuclease/phosphatase family metal-dependent hydrolase